MAWHLPACEQLPPNRLLPTECAMFPQPTRRVLLSGLAPGLLLATLPLAPAVAQSVAPASTRATAPVISGRANVAWTLKTPHDIRWQQITPAGTLLLSTEAGLLGVDIERGQIIWEKPELGGLHP